MSRVPLNNLYDLEDLALDTGATIEYADGRKFNTGGVQSLRTPRATPPAPAPTPVPAPVEAVRPLFDAVILQQLIAALNRPVTVTLENTPAPSAAVQATHNWTFEFERNPNGTIKRIYATTNEK